MDCSLAAQCRRQTIVPAGSRLVVAVRIAAFCASLPAFLSHSWAQNNALTAQVAIDVTQIKRSIPTTLYGTNMEYAYEAAGLWNTTFKSFDFGVWSNTFAVTPSLYRFPGGVYSDSYHWANGIGPRSSRPICLNGQRTASHHRERRQRNVV